MKNTKFVLFFLSAALVALMIAGAIVKERAEADCLARGMLPKYGEHGPAYCVPRSSAPCG